MKTYLNKSAKQIIEEIRGSTGCSDEAIANEIGVFQSTISRIRRGDVGDTTSEIWKRLVLLHRRKVKKAA